MNQQQVNASAMVRAMPECSVYAAPTDPGLTMPEIREAAGRLGLLPGEVTDALNSDMVVHGLGSRYLPHPGAPTWPIASGAPPTDGAADRELEPAPSGISVLHGTVRPDEE